MRRLTIVVGAWLLLAAAGRPASAQTDHGPLARGLVSAATSGDTAVSFSGHAGYRFNRVLGFGIDITSIRALAAPPGGIVLPASESFIASARLFAPTLREEASRDITVFTTNLRLEVPTVSRRVIPYVIAGGGVANVTEHYTFSYDPRVLANAGLSIFPPLFPQDYSYSTLFMALTLGGGASLLVTDHLAVDVDARSLALVGTNGYTIGRFGVGMSYRF